jgi:hypothetical protein
MVKLALKVLNIFDRKLRSLFMIGWVMEKCIDIYP